MCIFLLIFTLELALRIRAEGKDFPWKFWNIFDSSIVGIGVLDLIATFLGTPAFKHELIKTNIRRHHREIFTKFSRNFPNFHECSQVFEVFGGSETCWDLSGPTGMHSDTFGYVGKRSEAFGRFRNFSDFFRFFSRLCQIPAKPMMKCVIPRR